MGVNRGSNGEPRSCFSPTASQGPLSTNDPPRGRHCLGLPASATVLSSRPGRRTSLCLRWASAARPWLARLAGTQRPLRHALAASGAPVPPSPGSPTAPPARVTLSSPPSAGHGGRRLRVSPAQVHRAVLRLRAEDAGQKPQGGGDPFQFHQQVPGLAATLGQGRGKGPT